MENSWTKRAIRAAGKVEEPNKKKKKGSRNRFTKEQKSKGGKHANGENKKNSLTRTGLTDKRVAREEYTPKKKEEKPKEEFVTALPATQMTLRARKHKH